MKRLARASLAGAALLAASALVWSPAASGQGAPPGNNGTVKIDGIPFDDHPNNEPHVGCVFQVDFEGYDEVADRTATVTFALQPPTGGGVLVDADPVDISGGSGSKTYDLTQALTNSGVAPHPQQGWHIKLTVHAEGSQGADVKHKVFWVTCEEVPVTTTPTTKPEETTTTTTKPTGQVTTSAPGGRPGAPQAPPASPVPTAELAVTGSSNTWLAITGAALLLVGAGLGVAARRRTAS